MKLPFGDIEENRLIVAFSSADYSVANVLAAIKERSDMFSEMQVLFLGVSTEIPSGPSPVFRPVGIKAYFHYTGKNDPKPILERVYVVLWEAVAMTFPSEGEWATAKADFGAFVSAQAELLRARAENSRSE